MAVNNKFRNGANGAGGGRSPRPRTSTLGRGANGAEVHGHGLSISDKF